MTQGKKNPDAICSRCSVFNKIYASGICTRCYRATHGGQKYSKIGECSSCHKQKKIEAKRMCRSCYNYSRKEADPNIRQREHIQAKRYRESNRLLHKTRRRLRMESIRADPVRHARFKILNKARSNSKYHADQLKKKECESCGSIDRLELHHTEYTTEAVRTLCRKCHVNIHKLMRRGLL